LPTSADWASKRAMRQVERIDPLGTGRYFEVTCPQPAQTRDDVR
jgi:hypothetical protein